MKKLLLVSILCLVPLSGFGAQPADTGRLSTRLNITANGHTCSKVNPSSVTVGAGSAQDLGLNTNTGALYKAAWNYGLNFEDETINAPAPGEDPPHTRRGVHNHAFSQQGLLGAISAVNAVAP